MEDKIVETGKVVGFVKKHAKGLKRGLIAVGGLAALGIAGAIINNKRSSDEPEVWSEEADREEFDKDFPENSEE